MTVHVCEVCFQVHVPAPCCFGCPCGTGIEGYEPDGFDLPCDTCDHGGVMPLDVGDPCPVPGCGGTLTEPR